MKQSVKLARKWKCDQRTIYRWQKAGAPLDSADDEMLSWLAAQKTLPAATQAMVNARLAKSVSDDDLPTDNLEGAAAALRRLEAAERTTYKMLQAALKTGNPSGIKVARENWLAIGNQLRQYDRQVARDQRDSGELIKRASVEYWLGIFIHDLVVASRVGAGPLGVKLISTQDPITAGEVLRADWIEHIFDTVASWTSHAKCGHSLPLWWRGVMVKALNPSFRNVEESITEREKVFQTALKLIAGAASEMSADHVLESSATSPTFSI
jgi:hypothetical protein